MTPWAIAGWLGNGCFFARGLVQWWEAERLRTDRAPRTYWGLSLMGSLLVGSYVAHAGRSVLLAGFLVNGFIYLRNFRLDSNRHGAASLAPHAAAMLALMAFSVLLIASLEESAKTAATADGRFWFACVVAGQALWSSRFVIQWWCSEHSGRSHFPAVFWLVSLAGNVLLLAYAFRLGDAILIAGLALGPVMQIRNLVISRSLAAAESSASLLAPERLSAP